MVTKKSAKKKTTRKTALPQVPVRVQFLVVTAAVLLLVVFGLFITVLDGSGIYRKITHPTSAKLPDVTVKGTSDCLPHRNTDGPQTLECAQGVKTESGVYYAIIGKTTDRNDNDNTIEVTGTLVPATGDEKYDIVGTIEVAAAKP